MLLLDNIINTIEGLDIKISEQFISFLEYGIDSNIEFSTGEFAFYFNEDFHVTEEILEELLIDELIIEEEEGIYSFNSWYQAIFKLINVNIFFK